jgi:hypothetical protein
LYKTFHAESREEMVAIAWELELVTNNDTSFYSKKKNGIEFPEWAVNKMNNEKLLKEKNVYDYQN